MTLRQDALSIWQSGVAAVRSETLVKHAVRIEDSELVIDTLRLPLGSIGKVVVVGAGKAGAGMASAVEEVLAPTFGNRLSGWVNVPADCVRELPSIHLHPARPAGVNEPTEDGVRGTKEILKRIAKLGPHDVCLCLISGGGSALLPAPAEGISLELLQRVTQFLSSTGANIEQLNTVRKQLSRVKGGGLARACQAGKLISLIISDVLHDPLDVIASGPTVTNSSTAADALEVLTHFQAREHGFPQELFRFLENRQPDPAITTEVHNCLIGSNQTAVDAAAEYAKALGYTCEIQYAQAEGQAAERGRDFAQLAVQFSQRTEPMCLISGGEPVVTLPPAERRGIGGRNQHLVLAALEELRGRSPFPMTLISGGTDGEDGPTDAAGAILDTNLWQAAQDDAAIPEYLSRADAYTFFQNYDALLQTGPTHTNVMDLRVLLVAPQARL